MVTRLVGGHWHGRTKCIMSYQRQLHYELDVVGFIQNIKQRYKVFEGIYRGLRR